MCMAACPLQAMRVLGTIKANDSRLFAECNTVPFVFLAVKTTKFTTILVLTSVFLSCPWSAGFTSMQDHALAPFFIH